MSQSPPITELLCFDIYAASRAITGLYRSVLAPWGLTYPQYLVIVVLDRETSCTVKDLGEALQLDYGTLTPLLRRLESSGVLTRTRSKADERVVNLELTAAGRTLAEATSVAQEQIRAAVGLREPDAAALQATLRRLTGSVRAHTAS